MTRSITAIVLTMASASVMIPAYFASGFTHILPYGPDHVLLILALFFLTRKPADLLFQLTLFTLAHSLTLGLSLYGLIGLPETLVEVSIAISIIFVALENLRKESLSPWRPWVVFASGLVHGLGFAHSFPAVPEGGEIFLIAMFSFNLGIELGQITVVALAYAAVAAWWKHARYKHLIARPASILIATSGLYWAIRAGL